MYGSSVLELQELACRAADACLQPDREDWRAQLCCRLPADTETATTPAIQPIAITTSPSNMLSHFTRCRRQGPLCEGRGAGRVQGGPAAGSERPAAVLSFMHKCYGASSLRAPSACGPQAAALPRRYSAQASRRRSRASGSNSFRNRRRFGAAARPRLMETTDSVSPQTAQRRRCLPAASQRQRQQFWEPHAIGLQFAFDCK